MCFPVFTNNVWYYLLRSTLIVYIQGTNYHKTFYVKASELLFGVLPAI